MRWRLADHEEKRLSMKNWAIFALLFTMTCACSSQADELGRLFFSPDERQAIDQQQTRHESGKDDPTEQTAIVVNGVVQHGDGSRTAWINGKSRHNAPGKDSSTVDVTIPGKKSSVEVKVGQRLLLDNLPASPNDSPPASKQNN